MRLLDLYSRLSPILSLGSGLATVVLVQRGAEYAPLACGFLLLAWVASISVHRWSSRLTASSGTSAPPMRTRLLLLVGKSTAAGLYQSTVFFLLPLWWASTVFPSIHVIPLLALLCIAIASCFDEWFHRVVLARPLRRAALTGTLLLFALAPIAPYLLHWPLRPSVALSGALAAFLGGAPLLRSTQSPARNALTLIGLAGLLLAAGYLAAPALPPVPLSCQRAVAATAVVERLPRGQVEVLPSGTAEVYAYFAVAAPASFRQDVVFRWYKDGQSLGKPIATAIVGGRKAGFRTWTHRAHPAPGHYRVDLSTADGQLLGRVTFRVR